MTTVKVVNDIEALDCKQYFLLIFQRPDTVDHDILAKQLYNCHLSEQAVG